MKCKKLVSLILALCMVLTWVPMRASAAEGASGTCGDNLTWVLDDSGTLTISGEGPMHDYNSREKAPWNDPKGDIVKIILSHGVTSIGTYAFDNCYNLTNVVIPDSITLIGDGAFRYCFDLSDLTIPESVTEIGSFAFYNCNALTEVTIPGSVISIGYQAFHACYGLTSITIPASVLSIGDGAFGSCGNLTGIHVDQGNPNYLSDSAGVLYDKNETVLLQAPATLADGYVIPDSVTEIGDSAFYDCTNLTSMAIPDGVTSIGSSAFDGCTNLTSVVIPDGVTSIGSSAFRGCASLTSVAIPDSVTSIGSYAFCGCTNLTSVTIPDGVTSIGSYAFCGCTNLTSVTIPDGVTSIGSSAFEDCTSLSEITFGKLDAPYISDEAFMGVTATAYYPDANATWTDEKLSDYGGTLTWQAYDVPPVTGTCGDNISWTFDDGVLTITGTGAMYDYWTEETGVTTPWLDYCQQIVTVNMSDGITNIGAGAFGRCFNLTSIKLSSDITTIGDYAFYGCSFTSIELPSGVTTIGEFAFDGTNDLESITFPAALKVIKEGAFRLSGVRNVYVPSLEYWCSLDFQENATNPFTGYISFAGPDYSLFVDGELVTDLVIPYGITTIGINQFAGYASLTSIQIPDSVTRIESRAFNMGPSQYNKLYLKEIVFPASVEFIGINALSYNDVLEKIVVLNPKCELEYIAATENNPLGTGIYSSSPYHNNSPVIYGFAGSTAEDYATKAGFEFVALKEYEIINGANSTVNVGEGLTIRANGDFSEFESVAIDGLTVDPSNYTASEGSTVITFKPEYLSTLDEREHSITVFFTDGVAATTFTIPKNDGADEIIRLAGSNRFETAVLVADQLKQTLGVETFDAIILANGYNFADALSGSYLAAVKNAPILLTWNGDAKYDYLNKYTVDYVKANLKEGGTVYILGGTSAVPETVDAMLEGYNIVRMDGANRFETNIMILEEAGVAEGQEILVCTSTNFADSLSASAAGLPILLVWNEGGMLFDSQTEYLSTLTGNTFCVIGGENAVSADLANVFSGYGETTRLAGANRFETSVLVAEKYFDSPESAVLAYAWDFPDGLCGGSLAYAMDAPLILTMTNYESQAASYIQGQGITGGIVLGGTGLISDDSVRAIFAMDVSDQIIVK